MLMQLEFLIKLSDFFTETLFEESSQIGILMSRFGGESKILVHPRVALCELFIKFINLTWNALLFFFVWFVFALNI